MGVAATVRAMSRAFVLAVFLSVVFVGSGVAYPLPLLHGAVASAAVVDLSQGPVDVTLRLWNNATETERAFVETRADAIDVESDGDGLLVPAGTWRDLLLRLSPAEGRVGGSEVRILVRWFVDGMEASRLPTDQQALRIEASLPEGTPPAVVEQAAAVPTPVGGASWKLAWLVLGLVGVSAWIVASRRFLRALFLSLYSRHERRDVLRAPRRRQIYDVIAANPGIHYAALRRTTRLSTGTVLYHVRVLEGHGFIATRKHDGVRRFYVNGSAPPADAALPTPTQERVLALLAHGPLTQSELERRLGITQQGTNYHVTNLRRIGRVEVLRDGRVALADRA